MKTTVEVSDELMREVKLLAAQRGTSVRSLLEEALRKLLEEHRHRRVGAIRDASVDGGWMNPEYAQGGWEAVRDAIYEGRGT